MPLQAQAFATGPTSADLQTQEYLSHLPDSLEALGSLPHKHHGNSTGPIDTWCDHPVQNNDNTAGITALVVTCKPLSVTCGHSLDKSRESSGKNRLNSRDSFVRCRPASLSGFNGNTAKWGFFQFHSK
jgi:hypothetical protein